MKRFYSCEKIYLNHLPKEFKCSFHEGGYLRTSDQLSCAECQYCIVRRDDIFTRIFIHNRAVIWADGTFNIVGNKKKIVDVDQPLHQILNLMHRGIERFNLEQKIKNET